MCSGRRRACIDRRVRRDRRDRRTARLSSARIIQSAWLRSRTRIGTRLSLGLRRVPHVCPYRPVRTAEVQYSRCASLLALFGSLAPSPTSVVTPPSSDSRSNSDVADPNQNDSRPKAPLPGSSSHAADFCARIMPWRQPGDLLINIPIASIAPPPRPPKMRGGNRIFMCIRKHDRARAHMSCNCSVSDSTRGCSSVR